MTWELRQKAKFHTLTTYTRKQVIDFAESQEMIKAVDKVWRPVWKKFNNRLVGRQVISEYETIDPEVRRISRKHHQHQPSAQEKKSIELEWEGAL